VGAVGVAVGMAVGVWVAVGGGVWVAVLLVEEGVTETTKEDFTTLEDVALAAIVGVADAGLGVVEAATGAVGLAVVRIGFAATAFSARGGVAIALDFAGLT
jgi:hypothetical protein